MEENNKSGFESFEENNKTKWDSFKDNNQPVSVSPNGALYCGLVKEINKSQNYVTLQPAIFSNVANTEFFVENKPIKIPFDTIPVSMTYRTLEEYCQECNRVKLQERIKKGETNIIIPKPQFY